MDFMTAGIVIMIAGFAVFFAGMILLLVEVITEPKRKNEIRRNMDRKY